ncbi:MAG: MurR/RpiR family transcriptional regulator [Actinomycetota bacterium]|nr:MurR/RpiR family transcriptional regulator [Actinomycetota bacterium]
MPTAASARPRGAALHEQLLSLFEGHRLTPAQRRLAQYVLAHPRDVVFLGANDLAHRTNVSQPSVTRFAQALGFDGYPGLVRHLRGLTLHHPPEPEDNGDRNRYQGAVAAERRNLEALEDALSDQELIARLGRNLARSVPLSVLGLRASRSVAGYFAFFAAKVHPDVRLIEDGGSRALDQLRQARQAGGQWLLCFALPRCPRETVEALGQARACGHSIATVAEQRLTPAGDASDVVIPAAVGTDLVFDSQAAPMVLAAALLDAMSDAAPDRTQQRLEAFEVMAAQQRYFDTTTANRRDRQARE